MQTFKKIVFTSLVFLLVLVVFSCAVIIPWRYSEADYYMDSKLRSSLAGKIDFLVVGASHGLSSFIPQMIDENLGCTSYNLCSAMMPMYNRAYMLNKELNRNPVKTVILEISFDALTRTVGTEYGMGESVTLTRLDSFPERLAYLFKYIAFDDWLNIYCRDMLSSLSYLKSVFLHKTTHVDYEAKGYRDLKSIDRSLKPEEIVSSFNTTNAIGEMLEENISQFVDMIKMCKEKNCEIYVVCTPVSDASIWQADDWDVFYQKVADICKENDVPWLDFNLHKARYTEFSDSTSYQNTTHIASEGANHFTALFTNIVALYRTGENVSKYFYNSYADMKKDSPYMDYYLQNK